MNNNTQKIKDNYLKIIDFNQSLIKELQPYDQRTVKDLPNTLIKKLQTIKIGPHITSSGVEDVSKIIEGLTATNIYLEQAIEDPKTFFKINDKQSSQIPKKTMDIKTPSKPSNSKDYEPVPKIKISLSNHSETKDKSHTKPNAILQTKPKKTIIPNNQKNISTQPPTNSKIEL